MVTVVPYGQNTEDEFFSEKKKSLFLKYLHAKFSYENRNINDTAKILDFRNKENIFPKQCTLS